MATILDSIADFTDDQPITIGGTLNIMSSKHFNAALQKLIALRIKPTSTSLTNVTDPYSKISLECMLNNLECFSEILLASFCDGRYIGEPSNTPPHKQIFHSSALTREFALNAILQQTEIDATAIALVINDRQNATEVGRLKELDKVANVIIESLVNAGIFDTEPDYVPKTPFIARHGASTDTQGPTREPRQMPLVHFNGSVKIRMNPYCPVTLISLPIDLIDKNPNDPEQLDIWLKPALAYEIGQLAFWKGSRQDKAFIYGRCKFSRYLGLEMQRKGFSKWVTNAVAGIFADVFMTLQCGENALGHAIRRAQPRKLDRFHGEDLRYQLPPLLRPEVCIKTLTLLGKNINSSLLNKWDQIQKNVYGRKEVVIKDLRSYSIENIPGVGWQIPQNITNISIWKQELKTDFTGKQLPPINVTVYSDSGPTTLGFDSALEEVKRATEYVFDLLVGGLGIQASTTASIELDDIVSSMPASSPNWNYGDWQNGMKWIDKVALTQDLGNNATDIFFRQAWLDPLRYETRNNGIEPAYMKGIIDRSTYDEYYSYERYTWVSALYAGGWTMESPGNSGSPY